MNAIGGNAGAGYAALEGSWWCSMCGSAEVAVKSISLDPRYPLVKCRNCRSAAAGMGSAVAARQSAEAVHERHHGPAGLDCPRWCPVVRESRDQGLT